MSKQYNAIVFTGDVNLGNEGFITYHKVHSLTKFEKFINEEYPYWRFYTLYDHATKRKIEVIKKGKS
jgi:hypothetical protein